jgi:hypothetical protein
MLNKIPNELQGLIIDKLDPKSKAKLRVVSKEMRRAVNDVNPPTGSYRQKTGRFQTFWSAKRRDQCLHRRIGASTSAETRHTGFGHVEFNPMSRLVLDECIRFYKGNKLLIALRNMRTEDLDQFMFLFETYYRRGDPYSDEGYAIAAHDLRNQKRFIRSTTRLLKQWGETDPKYSETYHMVRRNSKPYTTHDEKMHADRVMDALLIQYIANWAEIDPTKAAYTTTGRERTLDEKVRYVTSLCRARTRDAAKPKKKKKN